MERWEVLVTLNDRIEAEILRGLLEEHGISCLIQADDAGGMQPHLARLSGVLIRVRHSDFMRARQILEATPVRA